MIDPTATVHPLAHVEGSTLGAHTKVWQFASITRGTVLGDHCSVAPFALLDGPRFGSRCIVSMHCAIGPGFWIGDDVFIGPSVTFANDAWPRADKSGWDVEVLRKGGVCIRVGDGASIGANAVILPGVVIGPHAVVAAGAVVGRDVPGGMLVRRSGEVVPVPDYRPRMRLV